jgi:glycosyltransferase involved in cell wall biosynthesis
MKLLVTIPCLNEEETIAKVINNIPTEIDGVSNIDVLIINDGSLDKTEEISLGLGASVINHKKNYGVGEAFKSAYSHAERNNYDLMVNIDGDDQFDSKEISKIIIPILQKKADLVIGSRFVNGSKIPNQSNLKYYGNMLVAKLISSMVGENFKDVSTGFRAYSKEAILNLNLHGSFTYTQETFLEFATKKLKILEVPVSIKYFKNRKSRVFKSLNQYAFSALKIILKGFRDYYPMKFFGFSSLIFLIPGIAFSVLFFFKFFTTGQFSGYLFSGFLGGFFIFLSLIIFLIGVVADMLDRIRVNQERILYNIKKNKKEK